MFDLFITSLPIASRFRNHFIYSTGLEKNSKSAQFRTTFIVKYFNKDSKNYLITLTRLLSTNVNQVYSVHGSARCDDTDRWINTYNAPQKKGIRIGRARIRWLCTKMNKFNRRTCSSMLRKNNLFVLFSFLSITIIDHRNVSRTFARGTQTHDTLLPR